MSQWSVGEVVRDDYLIPLRPEQEYDGARVIVYRRTDGTFDNLGAVDISPLKLGNPTGKPETTAGVS